MTKVLVTYYCEVCGECYWADEYTSAAALPVALMLLPRTPRDGEFHIYVTSGTCGDSSGQCRHAVLAK